ncbi:MAG: hypothetical protein IJK04_08850, partial [Kiritimatiellae bacterium]|nr:hypothetical protein [Kiritimatiellia bacterium]
YAIDWSASQNVIASNLTDTVQLAAGETNFANNVQLAFYPTEGNVITNVNGVTQDPALDVYTYTVNEADATLTILAGAQAAPPAPTVITVAQTVGAHVGSISNGNFQAVAGVATPITITADQGYVIAQIVTNGAPVANALGETAVTFDAVFSDAEGANNSIIATFAKDNAWFLDPFVRTKTVSLGTCNNTFLASISPDENYFFVGNSPSAHAAAGAEIINVPGFVSSLNPEYAPEAKAVGGDVSNKALRGGAASTDLQLGIAGSLAANENSVIPFDGSAPYQVTHNIGAALDALDFGANSTYLYAGCYTSGYRSKVYKLSFANGLAQGDTLTVEATYDVASAGIARVRAICVETIGGNEYVYVAGGDDTFQGIAVIDTATGTVTRLLDVTLSGQTNQPMSIDVAGIADGTPRLYIEFFGSFTKIYALTADGLAVVSTEPVTTVPAGLFGSTANLFTLDGETNAVACANVGSTTRAYVLEKKPANLIVRGTFDQGVTADDRSVAFGAAASETFTAPVGETLISVKVNGVSQQIAEGATSFTYEAAELTQYVYIDMQSVEPQYTATYTGSENVIVTNTYDGTSYQWGEGEAVVPTQIACLSGTVLSFYPTEGNVITNVTIGGVEQTGFDPACYSITVISDTNLVVLAGATARTKPAWANDANDVKFWAWVDGNNVSDYDTVDYSAQYLMNVAPGVTPVLKIDSIQVGPGAAVIIVSATDGTDPISLATINGVLNVAVGSSVTALTPKALGRDPVVSQDGRAMVVISTVDGSFYRAQVDFAAAETALTPAVIGGE